MNSSSCQQAVLSHQQAQQLLQTSPTRNAMQMLCKFDLYGRFRRWAMRVPA